MGRRTRLHCLGAILVVICGLRLAKDLPTGRVVVAGWLRHEPFYEGRPLSFWVSQTKFKDDVTPLTVQEDPDASDGYLEREGAWKVLTQMGPAGVRALEDLLLDNKVIVRHRALMTLGNLGARARTAIPALKDEARREGDRFRSILAAERAGQRPQGAVSDDSNPAFLALTRILAIEAIYKIDRDVGQQTPYVVSALMDTLLYSNDDSVQTMAWDDLRGIDPNAEVPPFIPAPEGDPVAYRRLAAKAAALCRLREADALYRSDQRRGREVVLTLADTVAHTEDPWVRRAAWQGVHALDPGAEIIGPLMMETRDREGGGDQEAARVGLAFRLRKAEAYYQLTHDMQGAVAALMEVLVRADEEWVQNVALADIRRLDPDATVPVTPVIVALQSEQPDGARLAAKAAEFGRLRRAEALMRADAKNAPAVMEALIELLLRGQNKWVRNVAWSGLEDMDPQGTALIPAFRAALKDPSPESQRVAGLALQRLSQSKSRLPSRR